MSHSVMLAHKKASGKGGHELTPQVQRGWALGANPCSVLIYAVQSLVRLVSHGGLLGGRCRERERRQADGRVQVRKRMAKQPRIEASWEGSCCAMLGKTTTCLTKLYMPHCQIVDRCPDCRVTCRVEVVSTLGLPSCRPSACMVPVHTML